MLWHLIPREIGVRPVRAHWMVLLMHLLTFLLDFLLFFVACLALVLGVFLGQRRAPQTRLTPEFAIILIVRCRVTIRRDRQSLGRHEWSSTEFT